MSVRKYHAARYFHLGRVGVRLMFPNEDFAEQACRHIFLSDTLPGRVITTLEYILDEAIRSELSNSGRPNVVGISRKNSEDGRQRLLLQMFDQFAVALDFCDDKIDIRYPSVAPRRLLLDDVLQAAMQPVLDCIGGFILHGACMVRDGRAIVFMGNSGAGKSTVVGLQLLENKPGGGNHGETLFLHYFRGTNGCPRILRHGLAL